MSTRWISLFIIATVALIASSSWADEKPAPKPDGVDARLERIADQVAAYEILRGVFGKQLKDTPLDWLARSDYPAKHQFALCIRMATDSPTLPKDEKHAELVESTIRLATALSQQQARIKDLLVKDEDLLIAVLKERAAGLSDEKNAKALMTLEARYNETIAATDAADLARYAGQTPKEFLDVRQHLRDALLKTLRKKPDIQKLFSEAAEASAELHKSRKRVIDLIEGAEKKKGAQDKNSGADEDPELRLVRAEIGLRAARIDRASDLLEAVMKGKDVRNELEKARERLLLSRYALGGMKADVATRTTEIGRAAEAVEAHNKKRDAASEAEKARNQRLAASKEVADYKTASERLLGLAKERDKTLREASAAGKDIRTELEKSADKLNTALADSPEYQAAVKRLKAARRSNVLTDLELTESASTPLRAALLRVELAGKK